MHRKVGNKYQTINLYGRLLVEARPCWLHVLGYLLLSMAATPLALLLPLPLKIAVDSVIGTRSAPAAVEWVLPAARTRPDISLLTLCAVLVVVFALLAELQKFATAMLKTYVGERLVMGFRSRLFRHVQRLSLAYHDRQGTSDSNYRIQYDAPAITAIIIDSVVPLISASVMLGSMLYVMTRISPRLALVAMAISPLLLILTATFKNRLRKRWREAKTLESSAQSIVQEVLGAVRVVKAFAREEQEHARFVKESRSGMAARLWAAFHEHIYTLLIGVATAVGSASVLFVGVRDVAGGALSLGNLLLVMAYLGKLYDPLKVLGRQLAARQRSLASAERAFALLDEEPDVYERPDARSLDRAAGAIAFRNVCFGYGDGPNVLRHVTCDVPAGRHVGIVGRTGGGKTTLMSLLTRFYDPVDGQILLDGVDLRHYRLNDLRNQFSIVLQEPVLFSASIGENIAYGREGATNEDVEAAAKAANAYDFIVNLPDGFDTQVGERGMCLSGGERQRIALARAFLKDAPILILDEPTSSVDVKTEAQIMEAMERLMQGRTAFMIAHRLGTLAHCDVVLRVEDGALVEASRAEELRSVEELVKA